MKNTYTNIIILGLILLFSLSGWSQFRQFELGIEGPNGEPVPIVGIPGDGPRPNPNRPPEEFNFNLHFNNISVLLALENALARAQRAAADRWLRRQEETFRNEINRQLGTNHTNFRDAQRAFLRNFEQNFRGLRNEAFRIAGSHSRLANRIENEQIIYSEEQYLIREFQDDFEAQLDCNRDFGPGTCDFTRTYTNYVQGTRLNNVRSFSQLNRLDELSLVDFSQTEFDTAINRAWASGLNGINNNGSLLDRFVNNHISYYNNKGLQDKVFLMTAYLAIVNTNIRPPYALPIQRISIPQFWNSTTLLNLGKQNSPNLSEEKLVFKENYIENTVNDIMYRLGGAAAQRTYDRLMNLRNRIIQEHINELESLQPFHIEDGGKKVDPREETKCFDRTKSAKITVYVEQPIPNSREITADIGHTFIGIEQGGITRYLGFYPDSPAATLIGDGRQDAEIRDNSGSPFDVSITTDVTAQQLSTIIDEINNFPETYDLENYNCSDFGIQIGNQAGLELPATVGKYKNFIFKFEGRNPADLGEDIREIPPTNDIIINKNSGKAPKKNGKC